MDFGLYVHIPYCIQRCKYCDFTTFEQNKIMPMPEYVELLRQEIQTRAKYFAPQELSSIYFGGGTPSLLPSEHILTIIEELEKVGFRKGPNCEVTIEINPATLSRDKVKNYLSYGINRFSVGAQSFNDRHLKACGREHNSKDTRATLDLLRQFDANMTFDLLFALPHQTLPELKSDLMEVAQYRPKHLSAYCLTVPEGHSMSFQRPNDDLQREMFQLITSQLQDIGLVKYEISNFAVPGYESRHNLGYWKDHSYWGIGLSSHSYNSQLRRRFWNPKTMSQYIDQISHSDFFAVESDSYEFIPMEQQENLKDYEWLTDFCHTSLRLSEGLDERQLQLKSPKWSSLVTKHLQSLVSEDLLVRHKNYWRLTKEGELMSNQVFARLTFLSEDLVL